MVLVTQSFGREYEYRRAILAILSYYSISKVQAPTFLFTDKPEYFAPYFVGLPVEYVMLTPEKIKAFRGEIDFLHRMKIAIIEEAMTLAGTNIFYTDSDTFFIQDPCNYTESFSPEKSYMHLMEYEFEELRKMALPAGKAALAFIKYLDESEPKIPSTDIQITTRMASWNAGVMLLHKDHKKFLKLVFELTDDFFPVSGSHASEQYAFSIVLQSLTKIAPLDDVVYHYWYNIKKKIIDQFLERELPVMMNKDLKEKLKIVNLWVDNLPNLFDRHVDTLKDNAIQSFNSSAYRKGLNWTIRAFGKGAISDKQFVKDFLYHTKVKLLGH